MRGERAVGPARPLAAVLLSCAALLASGLAAVQSADEIREGKVCANCHADSTRITLDPDQTVNFVEISYFLRWQ